jgi:hypothetical protein
MGLLVIADREDETRFEPDFGVVKKKTTLLHLLMLVNLGISEEKSKSCMKRKKKIFIAGSPFFKNRF